MVRDRKRIAGIQEMGWIVIPIVAGDVRRTPARMCERIRRHLERCPDGRATQTRTSGAKCEFASARRALAAEANLARGRAER